LAVIAAGVFGAIVLAAPLDAKAQDTLKVGMDANYAPFSMIDTSGNLTGFDHDISQALCDAMKVTCDIQAVPYQGTFPALEAGKIDVVINSYEMTPERAAKYDLVGPYILGGARYMTLADSPIDGSEESLRGKSLGVESSSSTGVYAEKELASKMSVVQYDQINNAVLDLRNGRVDLVLGGQTVMETGFMKAEPGVFKFVGEPIYLGKGGGFILTKNNQTWTARLTDALASIIKSGRYAEISNQYFGRNVLER